LVIPDVAAPWWIARRRASPLGTTAASHDVAPGAKANHAERPAWLSISQNYGQQSSAGDK
jgi:hypothetical protein